MRKHDISGDPAEQACGLNFGRRDLLKLTGAGVAAFGAASLFNNSGAEAQNMSEEWDKTFPGARTSIIRRSLSRTATA
jgi:uncharacterized protein